MVLTMGAVNTACCFGAVAIARRRGGTSLMIIAASTLVIMSPSLVGRTYSDIWNPSAGLLPFTLLIFLAWTIGCGDVRLLPVAAIVASFSVQCHLTFVPPTAGLMVVAAVALFVGRIRPSRKTLLMTGIVLLICWSGPIVDEIVHRPGNVERVIRSGLAHTPKAGARVGARATVHTFGVPPWWLSRAPGAAARIADVTKAVSPASAASAAIVLAVLATLCVMAFRRRRRDIALAAGHGLVMALAMALVASGTPIKGLLILSFGYTLGWGTAAGAWAWLTVILGGLVLLAHQRVRAIQRPRALALLASAGIAASLLRLAAAGPGEDLLRPRYKPMRTLASRLEAAVPSHSTVLVTSTNDTGFDGQYDFEMGSIYVLRHRGRGVLTPRSVLFGSTYDPRDRPADYVLRVAPAGTAVPRGASVVLRTPAGGPGTHGLVITLARTAPQPAAAQ